MIMDFLSFLKKNTSNCIYHSQFEITINTDFAIGYYIYKKSNKIICNFG